MKRETRTARAIFSAFRAISPGARKALFKTLAILFYHFSEKNRVIALHNLVRAFPEKDIAELKHIAKGCYRNLGIVVAEFFDIPSMTKDNVSDWVEFEGLEHYEEVSARHKGVIFFTAHFGNWELLPAVWAIRNRPTSVVYREMDNPIIGEMVDRVRRHSGTRLISKEKGARKLIRALSRGEIVGILVDQNMAWQEGVFVDFFGRPAATTTGLATIALRTGTPVLSAFIYRMEDGRYRFVIGEEVDMIKTGDYDRDVLENTQRITDVVEAVIRQHPEQWFWLHQRWKTKQSQVVKKPMRQASQG